MASLTPKQIFHDCIWVSDETKEIKLLLFCVHRFFDKDARSSSMSYSQIAADCSLSERGAKDASKAARDRWLKIEVGKGFITPKGRQNLYHGIIPSEWVAELRRRRLQGIAVEVDPGIVQAADEIGTKDGCIRAPHD